MYKVVKDTIQRLEEQAHEKHPVLFYPERFSDGVRRGSLAEAESKISNAFAKLEEKVRTSVRKAGLNNTKLITEREMDDLLGEIKHVRARLLGKSEEKTIDKESNEELQPESVQADTMSDLGQKAFELWQKCAELQNGGPVPANKIAGVEDRFHAELSKRYESAQKNGVIEEAMLGSFIEFLENSKKMFEQKAISASEPVQQAVSEKSKENDDKGTTV